jgi:hypothetical protein
MIVGRTKLHQNKKHPKYMWFGLFQLSPVSLKRSFPPTTEPFLALSKKRFGWVPPPSTNHINIYDIVKEWEAVPFF